MSLAPAGRPCLDGVHQVAVERLRVVVLLEEKRCRGEAKQAAEDRGHLAAVKGAVERRRLGKARPTVLKRRCLAVAEGAVLVPPVPWRHKAFCGGEIECLQQSGQCVEP